MGALGTYNEQENHSMVYFLIFEMFMQQQGIFVCLLYGHAKYHSLYNHSCELLAFRDIPEFAELFLFRTVKNILTIKLTK